MAIECFKVEWTKPIQFTKVALRPEAKSGGVCALFKGAASKALYIGKATRFADRITTHKQTTFRMMGETERKKCFVRLGLVSSFEVDQMTDISTGPHLNTVENFFITRLQPVGNGGSTKIRDTSKHPIIVVNTGAVFNGVSKYMSQSDELLKVLGKTATPKKRKPSYS